MRKVRRSRRARRTQVDHVGRAHENGMEGTMNLIRRNGEPMTLGLTRGTSMLENWHDEMDRVFERFFDRPLVAASTTGTMWNPALDITETDKDVMVKAELPGVDPARIEVKVVGDVLTLSGTKDESKEEKTENFHRSERVFGSFMRQVTLPETVDPDKVNAEYKNGVLSIKMTKKAGTQAKKIPISTK